MEGESNKLAGEVDTRNGFIPVVSPITQKRKSTKKRHKKRGKREDGSKVNAEDVRNLLGGSTKEKRASGSDHLPPSLAAAFDPTLDMKIEYVEESDENILKGRHWNEFKHVFEHFRQISMEEKGENKEDDEQDNEEEENLIDEVKPKIGFIQANYESIPENFNLDTTKLSKKKLKQLKRMKVAELKQLVKRPDLVEVWDVTAKDPLFLVWLKSQRNSVPVPKHWSQKRKFLQYKRGIQKAPFTLPDYIEATGIGRLRNIGGGHDPGKNIRQKIRERMNPKLGKMEIDYQVLHDAFFRFQKKPKLSIHGDVYFEGKEYEIKMRIFKPGRVSPDLRAALGIADNVPPPWLINMQRYGPPPSYPNLRIPGVNAPIPENIQFGWGKLFQDDKGFTVYADSYGLAKPYIERQTIVHQHWGERNDDEEEEEEEEDELEMNPENDIESDSSSGGSGTGATRTAAVGESVMGEGMGGMSSVVSGVSGVTTPDVNLRKEHPHPLGSRQPLYHLLEEYKVSTLQGDQIYPAAHAYQIPKDNLQGQGKGEGEARTDKQEEVEDIAHEGIEDNVQDVSVQKKVNPATSADKKDKKYSFKF